MEKVKMDKVRRMLGNRYGEDGRDAILAILTHIVDQGEDMFDTAVDNDLLTADQVKKGMKALENLITRANAEPKVVEVEEE